MSRRGGRRSGRQKGRGGGVGLGPASSSSTSSSFSSATRETVGTDESTGGEKIVRTQRPGMFIF